MAELERMKIDLKKRDFFKDRLSEGEIRKIITLAGMKPLDMLRKKDKLYKEMNLENSKFTDSQIIKLMVEHPGLIRRPIIIRDNKVHVGRLDPEKI